MELKFVNKLAVLIELIELKNARSEAEARGDGFYEALDKSAKLLGTEADE